MGQFLTKKSKLLLKTKRKEMSIHFESRNPLTPLVSMRSKTQKEITITLALSRP